MSGQKIPKGVITLGILGLLVVTSIQLTTADSGESATIIIGTESYNAECFDGGICIIPDRPVNSTTVEPAGNGIYWHSWIWHSQGMMWHDWVEIYVETTGCTGNSLCKMETIFSVQGSNDFKVNCFWDDGQNGWIGDITVNGVPEDCTDAFFDKWSPGSTSICFWESEVDSASSGHGGGGFGSGPC